MKFGVREICDVVFKAKSDVKIGNRIFKKGQPVLYIDTAKTSTVEGAATTVYATGGKGNTRLIAWEGEKTLTFTVEDALLSPIGFAVLSGAGLLKGKETEEVHVHTTSAAYSGVNEIDLTDALAEHEFICDTAPIFAVIAEEDGSITGELVEGLTVDGSGKKLIGNIKAGRTLFVDFYIKKVSTAVSELQIDAENFAGYYYVEATTLFRRQNDGVDMPAELTLPNVKIQSNFTFTMASTGDPSTFTFTMDAFPGYTFFNPTKKVLCAIQIIEDAMAGSKTTQTVFPHKDDEIFDTSKEDSYIEPEPEDRWDKSVKFSIPAQSETWLGQPISKMISEDTYVDDRNRVIGTIKYIDGFVDFNETNVDEQSGYYFPVKLDSSITGDTMTLIKNGVATKKDIPFDSEILLRIDRYKPNTSWTINVTSAGVTKEVATLYFREADFVE